MYSSEHPESPNARRRKTLDMFRTVFTASGKRDKEKLTRLMINAYEKGEKEHPEEETFMKNMSREEKKQFVINFLKK